MGATSAGARDAVLLAPTMARYGGPFDLLTALLAALCCAVAVSLVL